MTADGPANSTGTPASSGDEDSSPIAGSSAISLGRAIGRRVTRWVRGSAIYGWLTAEPEPDVIVIDLRTTWTVGPFLRILDRIVNLLFNASGGSKAVRLTRAGHAALLDGPLRAVGIVFAVVGLVVAALGTLGGPAMTTLVVGLAMAVGGLVLMRDDRNWATLRETRPVELAIAAFEPPEAAEGRTDGNQADDEDDRGTNRETEEKS